MSYDETPSQQRSSRRRALQQRRRDEQGQRRRKIQALAAGGLVLGVGATATLAAWTDEETTTGNFTTGQFGLESNTSGSDWESTETIHFENTALAPGHSVYAPVVLRLSPDTTVDGDITVSGQGETDGLNAALGFRAVTVEPVADVTEMNCSAETFDAYDSYVFEENGEYVSMSGEANAPTTQHLPAGEAETVAYCFEVQLDPEATNDTQQLTADYSWTFHAQSVAP